MDALISLLIVLLIFGIIMYVINTMFPIDPPLKNIVNLVIVVLLVIFLIGIFTGYVPTLNMRR